MTLGMRRCVFPDSMASKRRKLSCSQVLALLNDSDNDSDDSVYSSPDEYKPSGSESASDSSNDVLHHLNLVCCDKIMRSLIALKV